MTDPVVDLQNKILEILYEAQEENPFALFSTDSVVDEATQALSTEFGENDIDYALNRLDEEFLIDYQPAIGSRGSISLTVSGVDEYQDLSGGTLLEQDCWRQILSRLQELDRESPGAYWEGDSFREEFSENNQMNYDVIDFSVWYLKERGLIDVSMVSGNPPYGTLQITRYGRQTLGVA